MGRFLGSGPIRGQSPVEWGDFSSVRPFLQYIQGLTSWIKGLAGLLGGLAGWLGGLVGGMDEQTENLPILQDFVHYQGRHPKTINLHTFLVP